MNRKNQLIIAFIFVLFILGCANTKDSSIQNSPKTPFSNPSLLQSLILKNLGQLPSNFRTIEFAKIEQNSVTVNIIYKSVPKSLYEVERDERSVALIILNTLRGEGYNPRENWFALFVHARTYESGVTGAPVVRRLGATHYDFNSDQLVFDPSR